MATPADDVGPRFRLGLTALLIAIATWGVVDLALDRPHDWLSVHVLVELGFVLLSTGSVLYLWLGWMQARRSLGRVEGRLAANEAERDRWRARATRLLHGLGVEIDAQFERWSLTPAERQVALLLLKGLGHKEAADVLDRSERTVRQHAVSVYRKSGLSGRAELAAFFLEDLLLPMELEGEREQEGAREREETISCQA
jgi:DNA-binding CsgD family transcriptional regulator